MFFSSESPRLHHCCRHRREHQSSIHSPDDQKSHGLGRSLSPLLERTPVFQTITPKIGYNSNLRGASVRSLLH
ncbi:unnamed protein product, partial [Vitis vinifera]|uniref:Uncharacterized protein n=1 Tax=Vitis vinifera TaxID=29760 RepID=D7U8S6_VITVI